MSFFVLLSIFRNSAIKDGELTPSRQKKEMSFFVLLSIFRNFALAAPSYSVSEEKTNEFVLFFARLFVTLHQHLARE